MQGDSEGPFENLATSGFLKRLLLREKFVDKLEELQSVGNSKRERFREIFYLYIFVDKSIYSSIMAKGPNKSSLVNYKKIWVSSSERIYSRIVKW